MVSNFSTETAGSREMIITYTKNGIDYTTTVDYTVYSDVETSVLYISQSYEDGMGTHVCSIGFGKFFGQAGIKIYLIGPTMDFL